MRSRQSVQSLQRPVLEHSGEQDHDATVMSVAGWPGAHLSVFGASPERSMSTAATACRPSFGRLSMSQTTRMPVVFFGHGNPMNALERNRYSDAWRAFGESIPKPKAVLCVSAHWYILATAATAMPHPKTI